ncbi:putative nuclease HARBI1 [Bactrocera neohumeralis]|uniref:putative nuclease HARBI1 n=1 Tax=Bactrocera neohumeralis TaxID=98809 RepID=UPI0021664F88|nr:putative nuclease HARBI1 [Bactrocera neohumeralis]
MVLNIIEPHLQPTTIPPIIQLAATLRFLAEGAYQRGVGRDSCISLARSTVSQILTKVMCLLENYICGQWVKLSMDDSEKLISRNHFFGKYKIPGIVGCIDGTHIKIIKPPDNEHLYFNRKGYFSINAMIICDNDMQIRAVDARYPGSSHDAFIWGMSHAKQYFRTQYESGQRSLRLLGDCGYGIEPFLLTPYRDPQFNSMEYKFNIAHTAARNIVERTIGVLKSRFRCLMSTLHYRPEKVVKIVNVCCALHNICRRYNIEYNQEVVILANETDDGNFFHSDNGSMQSEGRRIRDEIANTL